MANQEFKIQDKTIVLLGPVTGLTHSCTGLFTENGADVAIICKNVSEVQRYTNSINDLREMNSSFGKAIPVECQFEDKEQISNAMGQATEYLGGVETFIDFHTPVPAGDLGEEKLKKDFTTQLDAFINTSKLISEIALEYISKRERGHLISIIHSLCLYKPIKESRFDFYKDNAFELSKKLNKASSVNCLSIGLTEEYLVKRYKDQNIADSLKKIQKEMPHAKLVETNDIASHLAFISGGLSKGLNGQVININFGLCQ